MTNIKPTPDVLANLIEGLTHGSIRVIDLTTPLTPETPALRLPAPLSNVIDLSLEEVAAYDERGPMWAHNNIHVGEHFGTHVDARHQGYPGGDAVRGRSDCLSQDLRRLARGDLIHCAIQQDVR